jgi:Flp pilus assembly protein TadD
MTISIPQDRRFAPLRIIAVAALALTASGCLSRQSADVTGSIGTPQAEAQARQATQTWGQRFEANPGDPKAALNYARALRTLDQRAQALAVLQQAAIKNPRNHEIMGAYGKSLADVGRFKEAASVLARAHTPEKPDWRILSAQGAVADQSGDHVQAQQYYEAALKIVPGEPSVLSNLGLSYALSKRLPEAERALTEAARHKAADQRVRQNLALVLGLQGKFDAADAVLRQTLAPEEARANLAALREMVSQPNSWAAIRSAESKKRTAGTSSAAKTSAPRTSEALDLASERKTAQR